MLERLRGGMGELRGGWSGVAGGIFRLKMGVTTRVVSHEDLKKLTLVGGKLIHSNVWVLCSSLPFVSESRPTDKITVIDPLTSVRPAWPYVVWKN